MGLLEKMQFSIDSMTLGERFLGSMVVTLLGVGIVFLALATLYFAIVIMQRTVNGFQPKREAKIVPITKEPAAEEDKEDETIDNTELVAIITAAIAASLHTSTHNIIVRNITRTTETTPSWAKIGRIDQISNKL